MCWVFFILFILISIVSSTLLFFSLRRINQYENLITQFQQIVEFATQKMKQVDARGHYEVKVTDKEYLGIKLTDGLYDDANTSYLKSYNPDFNLRSNMAYILHQADMMATHIEYDQWKRGNNKSEPVNTKVPKDTKEQKKVDDLKSKFDELFA